MRCSFYALLALAPGACARHNATDTTAFHWGIQSAQNCSEADDSFFSVKRVGSSLVAGGFTNGNCAPGAANPEYLQQPILYKVPLSIAGEPDAAQSVLQQLSTSGSARINGVVALGNRGHVAVCGSISGHFLDSSGKNTTAAQGLQDIFVSRFDKELNHVWTVQYGSAADDTCAGIIQEPSGDIIIAGTTKGDLFEPLHGSTDIVLVRLSPYRGRLLSYVQANRGGANTVTENVVTGIAMRLRRDIVIVGWTGPSLAPKDSQTMPRSGMMFDDPNSFTRNAFARLYTYDVDANIKPRLGWDSGDLGTDAADDARAVAVDSKGDVFIAGSTRGNFPGRAASNSIHTFVIELEGYTGKVACTRQLEGSGADEDIVTIRVDDDSVVVAGGTSGSIKPYVNKGGWDMCALGYKKGSRCSDTPDYVWQAGTEGDDQVRSVLLASQLVTATLADTPAIEGDPKVDGKVGTERLSIAIAGYTAGSLIGKNLGGFDTVLGNAPMLQILPDTSGYTTAHMIIIGVSSSVAVLLLLLLSCGALWRYELMLFKPSASGKSFKDRVRTAVFRSRVGRLCCSACCFPSVNTNDNQPLPLKGEQRINGNNSSSSRHNSSALQRLHGNSSSSNGSGATAVTEASGVPADIYFRTGATTLPSSTAGSAATVTSLRNSSSAVAYETSPSLWASHECHFDDVLAEFAIRTSDIKVLGKLGEGNFGSVFRGTYQGQKVAVKKLLHTAKVRELRHEVRSLGKLRHPNVAFFYGSTPPPEPLLVSELLWGSLFQLLHGDRYTDGKSNGHVTAALSPQVKFKIAQDVCRGMAYIHSRNILHRDISSSNVLLTGNAAELTALAHSNRDEPLAKLCDFGLSRPLDAGQSTAAGNLFYCAPEVYRGEQATSKSDVYSYGIVVWEAYTEEIPFADQNTPQLAAYSAAVNGLRPSLHDTTMPTGVAFLVQDCWHAAAALRPGFEVVLTALEQMNRYWQPQPMATTHPESSSETAGTGAERASTALSPTQRVVEFTKSVFRSPPASPFRFPPLHDTGGTWQALPEEGAGYPGFTGDVTVDSVTALSRSPPLGLMASAYECFGREDDWSFNTDLSQHTQQRPSGASVSDGAMFDSRCDEVTQGSLLLPSDISRLTLQQRDRFRMYLYQGSSRNSSATASERQESQS